jgi:NTP pyrophosphatase (non-canonical NTP hydrolase)
LLRSRSSEKNHCAPIWALILGEEVGEVNKAVLESGIGVREELIQVAAVAVAWAEAIDREGEEVSP